jgi:spore photoproduct lyase
MFDKVFIERDVKNSPHTQNILKNVKFNQQQIIESIDEIWGRVKKPYLQKRETLNLFIANKKGTLVKEAPFAYGHGDEKHFYYIHAYNCIYECQYCYLQGYFNTPDLVLFVNHEEIIQEMKKLIELPENKGAWFHAGEYSDSLNLSHITKELGLYFDFFRENPDFKLELRTKSVNLKELIKLNPAPNIFVSFTLSSTQGGKAFDYKCPSVPARIKAIKKLVDHGYNIGIHLDPIIFHEDFLEEYSLLLQDLAQVLPNKSVGYMSIGVVRFTKDVYREVENNYPDSKIHSQDLIKSFDGKVRYNMPMRMWMMNSVKDLCIKNGYEDNKIYLCMEE